MGACASKKGELDAIAAFMQGRVRVTGNMAKLMSLLPIRTRRSTRRCRPRSWRRPSSELSRPTETDHQCGARATVSSGTWSGRAAFATVQTSTAPGAADGRNRGEAQPGWQTEASERGRDARHAFSSRGRRHKAAGPGCRRLGRRTGAEDTAAAGSAAQSADPLLALDDSSSRPGDSPTGSWRRRPASTGGSRQPLAGDRFTPAYAMSRHSSTICRTSDAPPARSSRHIAIPADQGSHLPDTGDGRSLSGAVAEVATTTNRRQTHQLAASASAGKMTGPSAHRANRADRPPVGYVYRGRTCGRPVARLGGSGEQIGQHATLTVGFVDPRPLHAAVTEDIAENGSGAHRPLESDRLRPGDERAAERREDDR